MGEREHGDRALHHLHRRRARDSPAFGVLVRPDKWRQDEVRAELARLVGEILRHADDDALLLFNGGPPVLRRLQGWVVVSARSVWVMPDDLGIFGVPVEVEDLSGVP